MIYKFLLCYLSFYLEPSHVEQIFQDCKNGNIEVSDIIIVSNNVDDPRNSGTRPVGYCGELTDRNKLIPLLPILSWKKVLTTKKTSNKISINCQGDNLEEDRVKT